MVGELLSNRVETSFHDGCRKDEICEWRRMHAPAAVHEPTAGCRPRRGQIWVEKIHKLKFLRPQRGRMWEPCPDFHKRSPVGLGARLMGRAPAVSKSRYGGTRQKIDTREHRVKGTCASGGLMIKGEICEWRRMHVPAKWKDISVAIF